MTRPVICISHETGADGHAVGRLVADRLGYRLVDEEIIALAAEKQKINPHELADVERRKSLLERILTDMGRAGDAEGAMMFAGLPFEVQDPNSLRALIRQTIVETANEGKVVIVSHAATYALADRVDTLGVFVVATPAVRAGRLMTAEGLDEKQAAKSIASNDAGRADYLKRFYGVTNELPEHYDLVVNTDTLSAAQAAELVVAAASF